jgi:Tfp pilus assembly protein PilW
MKLSIKPFRSGTTLVQMMVALACSTMILAAVLAASILLQRSFAAVEGYSRSEGDQLRAQDYIAMDCRRSTGVAVANNILTLTVPNYYDDSGNPIDVICNGTTFAYGAGSTTIKYYQSASNFVREVNGVKKAIATNVSTFTVTPQDLTSSVSFGITFAPSFTRLPGPGPIAGTTVYSNTFLRNAVARR